MQQSLQSHCIATKEHQNVEKTNELKASWDFDWTVFSHIAAEFGRWQLREILEQDLVRIQSPTYYTLVAISKHSIVFMCISYHLQFRTS